MPSDNWTNFMSGAHDGIGVIKHSNVPRVRPSRNEKAISQYSSSMMSHARMSRKPNIQNIGLLEGLSGHQFQSSGSSQVKRKLARTCNCGRKKKSTYVTFFSCPWLVSSDPLPPQSPHKHPAMSVIIFCISNSRNYSFPLSLPLT